MSQINWTEEVESLKEADELEQLDWVRFDAGQHKVKIVKEGNKYLSTLNQGKENEKTITKLRLEIEFNNKKFNWGIPVGITENSLYGQLALIGKAYGTLEGMELNLIVKGAGKSRDYTVIEALALMKPKEIKV